MNINRIKNIIDALGKKEDEESIEALKELGTNCPIDEIRSLTSKALVKKNNSKALEVIISNKGKGINDLSASVAMCTINELLSLKDKQNAMKVLEETIASSDEKEVIDTARSTKALMSFSL